MSIPLRIVLGIPFVLLSCLLAPVFIFLLIVTSPVSFIVAGLLRPKDRHDGGSFSLHTHLQPR
ncbi:hypothetical protein [Sporolituus thermophilus]|uniref:Uncharacterized protein n=1 Tax=Sporolituus thermophilus DSM 23256 TaxID=1123285 RepID=A0A1G7HGH1_9FIRM|nr:hypothetical protein [Sporolituus thermophilus]SDE99488.1 hypothetical protein SAMN05660235_00039 [Sporolituus thermophilus DSM 23256]